MDHHDRRLRSLAYRLLDDREDAVDAMQDVYVKAFGALPGFREKSSVGTWLYRITYTTCCEHLRQLKRSPIPFADEESPGASWPARDPADEATLHADLGLPRCARSAGRRAPPSCSSTATATTTAPPPASSTSRRGRWRRGFRRRMQFCDAPWVERRRRHEAPQGRRARQRDARSRTRARTRRARRAGVPAGLPRRRVGARGRRRGRG